MLTFITINVCMLSKAIISSFDEMKMRKIYNFQNPLCVHQQRVAGTTLAALSRSSPDCRRIDAAMPVLLFPLG